MFVSTKGVAVLDDNDEFERGFVLIWVPKKVRELHHVHAVFSTDRPHHWINLGGRIATVEDITTNMQDILVVDHHD